MKPKEQKMKVDIWSDIVCPFCYIGKRNFENALKQFQNASDVVIEWHSFQLEPDLDPDQKDIYQYLAARKGISYEQSVRLHENVTGVARQAGLTYNFDKAIPANTFNAHRLIQLAKTKGLGDEAEERLFSAYFTEGKDIGDPVALISLGKEIGLHEEDVKHALDSNNFAAIVDEDIKTAQQIGVRGVPFFVFNNKYAVSGAQPTEAFLEVLQKSFGEWKQLQ
jgi:protein disulfide-isomerase